MSRPSSELILKNTILRAGAGAGKTTTLTQTFLRFASDFKERNGKFPRIVVTTFTRKATQELKERLLLKALEDERKDLFQFVSSKSQVQISTIHGVVSLFLSRYGASIGLTPDYKIMSDSEVRKGARKIMRKYLLENNQLQELLEEYEFHALESALLIYHNEKVVAPGLDFISQETFREETEKIIKDISLKLRNVCLAISRECTNEKWQEYATQLANFSWQVEEQDFEGFYQRLHSFWESLTKPQFRKATPPFDSSLHDDLDDLRKRIDSLLEEPRYRPQFWDRHQKNCELFKELAENFTEEFMKVKLESGLLSMSDLETLAYKIIKESPQSAEKFSQEWDFWMVDEYQDTSPHQVEILRHLIGKSPVFVVGDPQQSIYLFRGARSEVFQEKVEEIRAQDGDVQVKLVNYRSTPEVLSFFNYYFTRLSSQFAAMTPAPDKAGTGAEDPVVQIILTETSAEDVDSAETLATVVRIQELLSEGVSPEQICVLGRTHRTLEQTAKLAQEYGVPLQLHSGSGFYERREVLDCLAILKFLVNPHDNANLVALLRSPWLNVPDKELASICHSGRQSFWRVAMAQMDEKTESHPLKILKKMIALSEERGLSWTLKNALIELGLFDYSARIDASGRREANLWKVVTLLSQEERRPGFNYLDFLDSSLETLSTDEGGEDADATPVIEPKRVNFMTVHASKGLQFEHVIVPGMGQDPRGSLAPMFSIHEKTAMWSLRIRDEESQAMASSILADQIVDELRRREAEEFNRVLYVALTRAKQGVTLLWDKKVGKKSWAANCPLILEEGLHQLPEFSYLVRVGNLQPQKLSEKELLSKALRPLWQSGKERQEKKYISVTEMLAVESGSASAPSGAGDAKKLGTALARAQQGTDAHRVFEAMKYTDVQTLLNTAEDELKKPLQFIAQSQNVPLADIIEQGFVEWGFALSYQGALLQGQIDLWGIVDDVLWLVDYKTGSQKYSETAFQQLELYAWALSKMQYVGNVKEIKLAVVYPLDEVIKVKELRELGEMNSRIETQINNYLS